MKSLVFLVFFGFLNGFAMLGAQPLRFFSFFFVFSMVLLRFRSSLFGFAMIDGAIVV